MWSYTIPIIIASAVLVKRLLNENKALRNKLRITEIEKNVGMDMLTEESDRLDNAYRNLENADCEIFFAEKKAQELEAENYALKGENEALKDENHTLTCYLTHADHELHAACIQLKFAHAEINRLQAQVARPMGY